MANVQEGGTVQPQTAGNDLAHPGAVLSIARPALGLCSRPARNDGWLCKPGGGGWSAPGVRTRLEPGGGAEHNATVGGDMEERIEGLHKSVSRISQRMVAPQTWLGSEDVNVLQAFCDLLELVQQMNTQIAIHTHLPGPTPAPVDAATFTAKATTARQLNEMLVLITIST